ncbi:MAG: extracellular solute-binding protein [Chloroflexota bacterium]|nr:extracellular solute-binding protein [Chloroflexota bacterium]
MRKLLAILAVAVIALSLGSVALAQDDMVEIEYWQYNFGARVGAMDMLIEQFEAENPGIDVIHNSDIPYANFRDELAASAPAGVGPDVVTLFYGWIPAFVDAGYLVPLPEDSFSEEFILETFSPMVANAKFEGSYWAIPTAVRSLALFWNKDLFAAAGLDPDSPPATLDEFVEAAIATTVYDGDASDVYNITTQGHAPALASQDHHWFREVLIRQFGGAPYSDDGRTVTYNSEEGCAAFSWLAAFETEHVTGSNDILDGSTNAFVNGESALHVDGSFRVGTIRNNNPDLNYGVTELPVGPNGEQHTFGSYWTHGITRRANDDPARLEAAIKFLQFITTPEAGTLWVNNVGELPAQLAAASDDAILADPILGPFSAGLAYSHATFFVDESAQRQVLIDAFDNVRLGGMDPCDALDEAAAAEQELIDNFWADRE